MTFHSENKLRTVLWQWAGDPLTQSEIEILERAKNSINKEIDLSPYLTASELSALSMRIDSLISDGAMPTPNPDWPAVPWPAF